MIIWYEHEQAILIIILWKYYNMKQSGQNSEDKNIEPDGTELRSMRHKCRNDVTHHVYNW